MKQIAQFFWEGEGPTLNQERIKKLSRVNKETTEWLDL